MKIEEPWDRLGEAAAEPALGSDPERSVPEHLPGSGDPLLGSGQAVPPVQQTQVEVGVGGKTGVGERSEVGGIRACRRDGQVHPGEGAPGRRCHRVGHAREVAGVARFDEVPMPGVAVAQVEAHLDRCGHRLDKTHEPLSDGVPQPVAEGMGPEALEQAELDDGFPLDGQAVGGHEPEEPVEVASSAAS